MKLDSAKWQKNGLLMMDDMYRLYASSIILFLEVYFYIWEVC